MPKHYVPKYLQAALVVNLAVFIAYGFFRLAPIQMLASALIVTACLGYLVAASVVIGRIISLRGWTKSKEEVEPYTQDQIEAAESNIASMGHYSKSGTATVYGDTYKSIACAGLFISAGSLIALGLLYLLPHEREDLPSASISRNAAPPIMWTQLAPNDKELVARAIVPYREECPRIDDRVHARLTKRQMGYSGLRPDFKITVCEYVYDGTEKAALRNYDVRGEETSRAVPLKERPKTLNRILVLGDTGCRITHYTYQECKYIEVWPFAKVALSAAKIARGKLDLIIHVGDYHYREKPCHDDVPGCAESPYGDNWDTWKVDFFEPAAPLLSLAPWVMLRGNHEDCARAGRGWHLFFDLRDLGSKCKTTIYSYLLNFGDLTLVVFDTAHAGEGHGTTERVKEYHDEIDKALSGLPTRSSSRTAWLLLHQPIWGSSGEYEAADNLNRTDRASRRLFEADSYSTVKKLREQSDKKLAELTKLGKKSGWKLAEALTKQWDSIDDESEWRNLQAPLNEFRLAFRGRFKEKISLVLSGDSHLFQLFQPSNLKIPLQIVAGMGGTALDEKVDKKGNEIFPQGPKGQEASLFGSVGKVWTRVQFGFLLLTRSGSDWDVAFYDVNGVKRMECSLPSLSTRTIQLACRP